MSLAHGLNDLAAAHQQHLINDDEYRLLRQALFEQHATEPATPAPKRQQLQAHPPHPPSPAPPPPLRRKQSVVINVAKLFRRATGRSSKKQQHPQDTPPQPTPEPQTPPPRRIHRKPSLGSLPHPSQPQPQSPPPSQDQQDDPSALRAAIASTEAEHIRLLDAFTSLESSTLKRIQYKTARRLYTPTPTNINVLIEGREWRRHTKPVPSIILPPSLTPSSHNSNSNTQPNHRYHPHPISPSTSSSTTAVINTGDQLSIRSASSSSRISLSRSFSSSIQRNNTVHHHQQQSQPHSPLSPRFHSSNSLHRQNSVSSASTHSTGTSSRLALGPRSTGNLYLSSLAERASTVTIADSRITEDIDDVDDPEATDYESALRELEDIRVRREEVNVRFLSRLEYLRARLKAAELHEKVMRR